MVDAATKAEVGKIGMLKTKAGPRDGTDWVARLKEEYTRCVIINGQSRVYIPKFKCIIAYYSRLVTVACSSNFIMFVTHRLNGKRI